MSITRWAQLSVLPLLSLCVAQAQVSALGRVAGHVEDVVGATIPRAFVLILNRSPEQSVRLTTQTDLHGDFIVSLPEGGYDIFITSVGFQAGVTTIAVKSGKSQKLGWKMKTLSCDFPGMNCDTFF